MPPKSFRMHTSRKYTIYMSSESRPWNKLCRHNHTFETMCDFLIDVGSIKLLLFFLYILLHRFRLTIPCF